MSLIVCFITVVAYVNLSECFESYSSEINRLENGLYAPIYDAIVFSDIADILNEFDNNGNSFMDALMKSGSESDENVEDLLLEYHHYLDKAQKQRKSYLERNKSKNKVPLLRHETYVKKIPSLNTKNENYYYYNPNGNRYQQSVYNSPMEMLIPVSPKLRYFNEDAGKQLKTDNKINEDMSLLQNIMSESKKLDFSPIYYNSMDNGPLFSSGCKECAMQSRAGPKNHNDYNNDRGFSLSSPNDQSSENINRMPDRANDGHDLSDNTLNIRVKVEIQLPKSQEMHGAHRCKNHSHTKNLEQHSDNSKEIAPSTMTLPVPYFNFPVPLDMFGYKKYYKMEGNPTHKFVIHKKKKPRNNTSNKKHKKKSIAFHNVKFDSHTNTKTVVVEEENSTKTTDQTVKATTTDIPNIKSDDKIKEETTTNKKNLEIIDINDSINNITPKNIVLSLNETNVQAKNDRKVAEANKLDSEDIKKLENVIDNETDESKLNSSKIEVNETIKRQKREIDPKKKDLQLKAVEFNKTDEKISNKNLFADSELLYWPSVPKNKTFGKTNNITSIILEREDKKAKLNFTHESIRVNHTRALEKAIFGDVDWDDMDTVAPVFISFVGKYIKGALTFCSQTICHSMKCADKTCVHRTCTPIQRSNQRGHCLGSNETDSVASMESIMDLPSNTAVEIVDILQDKLPGKLYGKITICISSKCISFATAKKIFLKSKCSIKELSTLGHCPYSKNMI